MKPRTAAISGIIVLAGVFLATFFHDPEPSAIADDLAHFDSQPPTGVADAPPTRFLGISERIAPVDPWRVSPAVAPSHSRASAKLVAAETTRVDEARTASGTLLRRFQLLTNEKYPHVTLIQELERDAVSGREALLGEIAYVSDHFLIKAPAGQSRESLIRSLATMGYSRIDDVGQTDIIRVSLDRNDPEAVPEALQHLDATANAEPDYLLFSSEVLDTQPLKISEDAPGDLGVIDPIRQLWVDPAENPRVPLSYTKEGFQERTQQLIQDLPSGARVLTFDPPEGWGGSFRPSVTMHRFIFNSAESDYLGAYIQNAYTAGYPHNGGNYYRVLDAAQFINLRHKDNLPFQIHRVDLAEYSTVFARPRRFTFVGTKADGSLVSQTFLTDGVIDGTGAREDFETFEFNASFGDLVNLRATGSGMYDNFVVTVNGQETPSTPPPAPPMLYDVNWNDQKIGEENTVGGRRAPSSINFGAAVVRTSSSNLTDQPVELISKIFGDLSPTYAQPRFDLHFDAKRYEIEFECELSDPTAFFLDGLSGNYTGMTRLDLVDGYSSYRIIVDRLAGVATVDRNGQRIRSYAIDGSTDIKAIRFSVTDSAHDGGNFLDNLKIYGYGIESEPEVGAPAIRFTPSTGIVFPSTSIGAVTTRSLRITNEGSDDLLVTSIASNHPSFTVPPPNVPTLRPGGHFYLSVNFDPKMSGSHQGSLTITSTDPSRPSISVPLRGNAFGVPRARIEPSALDVSVVQGRIGHEAFEIRNVGSGGLQWELIDFADSNKPHPGSRIPDDPFYESLWGLQATSRAGIGAENAWAITAGSPEVVTAVIDTGIDLHHPDLRPNLVVNVAEIEGNGVDDDHNGFIDDVYGWNFYDGNNAPNDRHSHGTHVAGSIAAVGENGLGVIGVAHQTRLLAVQFLGPTGAGFSSDAIAAVDYARSRGADLVNASWGGGGNSRLLSATIEDFISGNDALFVAAAGNDRSDNDIYPHYPSSYPLEGIVAVAATDRHDDLAYFSNFGRSSVDLAAPGHSILSCLRDGNYGYYSGTSMAAPHVSGSIALLISENPSMSYRDCRNRLLRYTDPTPGLNGLVGTDGRLNAYGPLARTPASWLISQPTFGHISADAAQAVKLHVNAAGLSEGHYNASLAFSTNDPQRPYIQLPVSIQVLPSSEINSWRTENFGINNLLFQSHQLDWSDLGNPDNDHYNNLMEYALGSSPTEAETGLISLDASGLERPSFLFQSRADLDGVALIVEWSPDLKAESWDHRGIEISPVDPSSSGEVLEWRATLSGSPPPERAFFRIRVQPE